MIRMYHNGMPRSADHDQRRTQIIDALVRVAARQGLHEVTMRSVAAEAAVSLRLVQYYFDGKAGLLNAALDALAERSNRRWDARVPQTASVRARVTQFLHEALPDDAESRAFHLLWTSYAVLAMSDPDLAAQPFVDGPNRLERELTGELERARRSGEIDAGREPAAEAARLLTLSHGLGTSVLVGQRSVDSARRVLAYHLDELFHVR